SRGATDTMTAFATRLPTCTSAGHDPGRPAPGTPRRRLSRTSFVAQTRPRKPPDAANHYPQRGSGWFRASQPKASIDARAHVGGRTARRGAAAEEQIPHDA